MKTDKWKVLYALLWGVLLCSATVPAFGSSLNEAKNENEVLALLQADTDIRLDGLWNMQTVEYSLNGGTVRTLNLESMRSLLNQKYFNIYSTTN